MKPRFLIWFGSLLYRTCSLLQWSYNLSSDSGRSVTVGRQWINGDFQGWWGHLLEEPKTFGNILPRFYLCQTIASHICILITIPLVWLSGVMRTAVPSEIPGDTQKIHKDLVINIPGLLLRELCSLITNYKVFLLPSTSHHLSNIWIGVDKSKKKKKGVSEMRDTTLGFGKILFPS